MSEADTPAPPDTKSVVVQPRSFAAQSDYPGRLSFGAPYFNQVPLAEIIEPAVIEVANTILPPLVQPAADAAVRALAVQKVGDTMTGPLSLPGLPTQPSHAATKGYVDSMSASTGVPEVPAAPAGQTWGRQHGAWTPLAGGTGGGVTVSATPPGSPAQGQQWWDSVGGQLYVWYNDGSSSAWVIAINSPRGATGGGGSVWDGGASIWDAA